MPSNGSWQKVRFDQICKNISNRIDDPKQANTDYYVGLEHLDSEEPKILRHGSPNDVGATKLRFKPGQILFGKRRWYLRKLAVAEREGICSAHMMVLEPIEGKITKEFLSILMQGEDFFEKARRVSAGSLSPTIKWKDLAKQEFLIPPIPEQETILSLTHQIDDAIIKTQSLLQQTKIYSVSKRENLLTRGIGHTKFKKVPWYYGKTIEIPEEWEVLDFSSITTNKKIKKDEIKTSDYLESGKYPIIDQGQDFISGYTNNFLSLYDNELPVIIFGDHSRIVKFIYFPFAIGADGTQIIYANNEKSKIKFLYYLISNTKINSEGYKRHFSILKEKKFLTPPLLEQDQIISILSNINEQISQQQSHISNLKTMRKSILNSKLTPKMEEASVLN